MNRRHMLITVMVVALAGLPGTPPAAAASKADFIAVNERGTVPVERDGGVFVWTADLVSLTTLDNIGTFTDRATCSTSAPPPCLLYDVTTTYRVPGGEVVSRGQWSVAPDPSRPGFAFAASRPEKDTILSGTGLFEGRTGRVSGWGIIDLTGFPGRIGLDFRTFIRFDPTDANVLGSQELVLGREPSSSSVGFRSELFNSKGVNESKDPTWFRFHSPLLSLSDGSQIGSVADSFTCAAGPPPCLVLDVLPVLQYPDGTVTVHTQVPLSPDPARPGFWLFGTRPTEDNVVSVTGAYAGRTGRLSISGSIDMRRFPSPIPYEGVGLLVFDN